MRSPVDESKFVLLNCLLNLLISHVVLAFYFGAQCNFALVNLNFTPNVINWETL